MNIDLYYHIGSAKCRSVLMLGKCLNIQFNLIDVDLHNQGHLSPHFVNVSFIKSMKAPREIHILRLIYFYLYR